MKTWEYISESAPQESVVDRLNALGYDEWEVISMTWIPPVYEHGETPGSINLTKYQPGTGVWLVFLKREGR